jgi:pimeloyl-ACP methyl ester carboxylesterase
MQVRLPLDEQGLEASVVFPDAAEGRTLSCLLVVPGLGAKELGSLAAEAYRTWAEALAVEAAMAVASFVFSPIPPGPGPKRALEMLGALVTALREKRTWRGIWLAGFGEGGALAICAGAYDQGIQGVACLGGPPELEEIGALPLELVAAIPPRPLLMVYGAEDQRVPIPEARRLAEAARGQVELRILPGADHNLRNDPRAGAIIIGWLERAGKMQGH